jgi:thiamine monophosphate kinase
MAAASGVVLRLDSDRIPRGEGISAAQALSSGEEYELLVACPPAVARELLDRSNSRGNVRVSDIGEVIEARGASAHASATGGVIVAGGDSRDVVEFAPGHDHFSS